MAFTRNTTTFYVLMIGAIISYLVVYYWGQSDTSKCNQYRAGKNAIADTTKHCTKFSIIYSSPGRDFLIGNPPRDYSTNALDSNTYTME